MNNAKNNSNAGNGRSRNDCFQNLLVLVKREEVLTILKTLADLTKFAKNRCPINEVHPSAAKSLVAAGYIYYSPSKTIFHLSDLPIVNKTLSSWLKWGDVAFCCAQPFLQR